MNHSLPSVGPEAARVLDALFQSLEAGQGRSYEQRGYQKFSTERVTASTLAICHTFEQHGDLLFDPEIVYWRDPNGAFYPLEIRQDPAGSYRRYAELSVAEDQIAGANAHGMRQLCEFTTMWMRNLLEQFPQIKALVEAHVLRAPSGSRDLKD